MREGRLIVRRRRAAMRTARTLLLATVLALALPGVAHAGGRLIETGHDADWGCARLGNTCHFIRVAVSYVRDGAPDPTKKLLVLDNSPFQMRDAIAGQFPGIAMDVIDPQNAAAWNGAVLSPSVYSALIVASDETCGNDAKSVTHGNVNDPGNYCDLNRPGSGWPPPSIGTPPNLADSTAINGRSGDIKRFFDAGGGVFVGSGADDGDGHKDDIYYQFIGNTGGAGGSACDTTGMVEICLGGLGALTAAGRAIGFVDSDVVCGVTGDGCPSHNSFKDPGIGSSLLVAELGPGKGLNNTLFADTNPPDTLITSAPGPALTVAPPAPPVAAVPSTSAAVGFAASEDTTSFTCSLDGGAASPCRSPITFTGLFVGVHKVTVTATDAAGNVDPTPAEISWLVAFDSDHDGYLKTNPFGAADCNDTSAAIHPNAVEIRGNRVDENCDQVIAPFVRLKPALAFHFVGAGCAGCVKFDRLALKAVPRAATVRLHCRGPHCPHLRRTAARAHHHKKTVNLLRLVRRLRLVPGRTLGVSAPQGGTIGACCGSSPSVPAGRLPCVRSSSAGPPARVSRRATAPRSANPWRRPTVAPASPPANPRRAADREPSGRPMPTSRFACGGSSRSRR